jgi:S1-C subfamily serine protease
MVVVRVERPGCSSDSGVVHLLVVVFVLLVAVLAIVVLRDSALTSSSGDRRSSSSALATRGTLRRADVVAVTQTVGPAIVDLEVSLANGRHVSAPGIVLTSAGEVVTNNHSIAEATSITARIAGTGRTYVGTVLGYDVADDVAVVGLAGASGLPTIEPADSSVPARSESVFVIKSTDGVASGSAPLAGVVTALDRQVEADGKMLHHMIEIDGATRGSDGGEPVVDGDANVVAMTTAASAGSNVRGKTVANVGFAIPIDDVFAVVDQVNVGHSTDMVHVGPSAALGVVVRPTSPHGGAGAYVVSVQGDGPAAKAGIESGGIVVSIDDMPIPTTAIFATTLEHYRPGDVVRVGWVDHAGIYRANAVKLGSGPPA